MISLMLNTDPQSLISSWFLNGILHFLSTFSTLPSSTLKHSLLQSSISLKSKITPNLKNPNSKISHQKIKIYSMSLTLQLRYHFSKSSKLAPFFPSPKLPTPAPIYPKQHPIKLDSKDTEIISIHKPKFYITPEHEVNYKLYKPKDYDYYESPPHVKSIEICLLGAPNAGKSSLLNKMAGKYISAVSDKANTTDERVLAIRTNIEKKTQIVMHDTPGITKRYKSSAQYISKAWEVVADCDKALLVVDCVRRLDDPLKAVIKRLKEMKLDEKTRDDVKKIKKAAHDEMELSDFKQPKDKDTFKYGDTTIPTYLILNKIDLCNNKRKLKWLINELEDLGRFEKVFYTSAETGYGIEELVSALEEEAEERAWEYNPEIVTDMSEVERLEELMKARVFERFFKELPFKIGIKLDEYRVRTDGLLKLEFFLDVATDDQKKILIGHHARNLKYLKEHVTADIARLWNKNAIVRIRIKKGKSSLVKNNQQNVNIVDPGLGQRITNQEIELFKKGKFDLRLAVSK